MDLRDGLRLAGIEGPFRLSDPLATPDNSYVVVDSSDERNAVCHIYFSESSHEPLQEAYCDMALVKGQAICLALNAVFGPADAAPWGGQMVEFTKEQANMIAAHRAFEAAAREQS